MITIFAIPKAFDGHIGIIQRNAIQSWTLLRPQPEILLFGDEKGTREFCREFECRHLEKVAKNEHGTPLLNDIFAQAQRQASHPHLCYVNSDIILPGGFGSACERVARWRPRFLMVGRRWDLDLEQPVDFSQGDWEERLMALVRERGQRQTAWAVDYFFFPRGCFGEIPAFAVGRYSWDSWLVWKVRTSGNPIVDASAVIQAVHQNHPTPHNLGQKGGMLETEEGKRNFQLTGGYRYLGRIDDASYVLTQAGIQRNFSRERAARLVDLAWRWLLLTTAPVRHPLGLRRRRQPRRRRRQPADG